MRVLVCGGRDYADTDTDQMAEIYFAIRDIHEKTPIEALIQGGARGADQCAADLAKEFGIKVVTVPADWQAHGRAAGPIRNQRMIDDSSLMWCLRFPAAKELRTWLLARRRMASRCGSPQASHPINHEHVAIPCRSLCWRPIWWGDCGVRAALANGLLGVP